MRWRPRRLPSPSRAEPARAAAEEAAAQSSAEPQATTTMEELDGLHAVRSIVRDMVSSKRIVMRDAQSYCAILLDDNNRKPVCRLRFNNAHRLRLGPFNDKREEEQLSLDEVDDIHNLALQLRATVWAASPAEAPRTRSPSSPQCRPPRRGRLSSCACRDARSPSS